MKSRRTLGLVLAAVMLVSAVVVVGVRWRHARQDAAALAASVPSRPDLGKFVPEFANRIADCERRIRSGNQPVIALGELSRLYHANGFYAEAMQGYRGLTYLDPDNALWPHLLATALAGYGELDEAIQLWRRAASLAPDYLPAAVHLADVLYKTNHYDEATAVYEGVRRRDPDNPYALIGLARLDIAAERWTQARDHLEHATSKTNRLPTGDLLAKVYERLGDPERALAERRQPGNGATDFCEIPDPWVAELTDECYDATQLVVASSVAASTGDKATARRRLERAVKVDPNNTYAQRQFGVMLAENNEWSRARGLLERAVELAPDESDNWVKLLWLLNRVGDQAAADRTLAAGLARCPNSPSLHLERGRALKSAGRLDEALAAFAHARELRPQEVDAYIETAEIYFRQNRVDDAIAQLRTALAAVPEHPVALFLLARHAIESGAEAEATDLVHRARQQIKIRPEELAGLESAYRERFGHAP